uniref:Uncharacterized protein n=1 Tax=Rhizophora mucronata TaxID=61149 RepID=A0A2P2IYK9_RHIMU
MDGWMDDSWPLAPPFTSSSSSKTPSQTQQKDAFFTHRKSTNEKRLHIEEK